MLNKNNEIGRRKFLELFLVGTGAVMLAGCGKKLGTFPVDKNESSQTPTRKPAQTETPTQHPTSTETTTPTETATPTEKPRAVKLSMDYTQPTGLSWEDLLACRFEGAIDEPFDEKAVFIEPLMLFDYEEYNYRTFYLEKPIFDPALWPVRRCGYGLATSPEGSSVLLIREDIHNADGTVGNWNIIVDLKLANNHPWSLWLADKYSYFPPMVPNEGMTQCPGDLSTPELCKLSQELSPNASECFDYFMETSIVSEEMSKCLLIPNCNSWIYL
jgi:hypothetical protein